MPPGLARTSGTWTDYTVWVDVYDHEEMQACEATPDPGRALGLRPVHARQLFRPRLIGLRTRVFAATP